MKATRVDDVRGYRIEFTSNTVYVNKKFAAAATRDFLSAEALRLREIQEAFPEICVVVKAGREITTPRRTKRLTYENMEVYIGTMDNADELLAQFELVKQKSKPQPSPYKYVRDWFEAQFPNYRDAKIFCEGSSDEKKLSLLPKASNE